MHEYKNFQHERGIGEVSFHTTYSKFGHHRQESLPFGSEMDLVARLVYTSLLRDVLVQLLTDSRTRKKQKVNAASQMDRRKQ